MIATPGPADSFWDLSLHPERESEVLAAVAGCPDRGPVLAVSMQTGGCLGGELSECKAGKGIVSGRVCLAFCIECRCEAIEEAR